MGSFIGCRFVVMALIGTLLFLPINSVDSFPNGVGEIANNGCLCHGAANSETEISVTGLPSKFQSNTTYPLQLILNNEQISPSETDAQGGFRVIITKGNLSFEDNEGQLVDEGWTHYESSNQQRMWNFSWTAPADNTTMSKFLIYGNAVNGNGLSNEDHWNVKEIYVPGEQNFDPIPNSEVAEHELELFDRTMLLLGLIVLLYVCFKIIKD